MLLSLVFLCPNTDGFAAIKAGGAERNVGFLQAQFFPKSHQALQDLQDVISVLSGDWCPGKFKHGQKHTCFCMVNSVYFKILFRQNVVIQLMKMNSTEAGRWVWRCVTFLIDDHLFRFPCVNNNNASTLALWLGDEVFFVYVWGMTAFFATLVTYALSSKLPCVAVSNDSHQPKSRGLYIYLHIS